jgi:hypothetical protein
MNKIEEKLIQLRKELDKKCGDEYPVAFTLLMIVFAMSATTLTVILFPNHFSVGNINNKDNYFCIEWVNEDGDVGDLHLLMEEVRVLGHNQDFEYSILSDNSLEFEIYDGEKILEKHFLKCESAVKILHRYD